MSDEPKPEVRALALKLFAAGRSERPEPALGRRLALIGQHTAPQDRQRVEARVERSSRAHGASSLMRSRRAFWLTAASVFVAAGLWIVAADPTRSISISPERFDVSKERAESETRESAQRDPVRETPPETSVHPPQLNEISRSSAPRPGKSTDGAARAAAPPKAPLAALHETKPMTLVDEIELLKDARAALRAGQGRQALNLLDRYARERSSSGLEAEATLLRIEALSEVGRTKEASELAARFVRNNPNSALGDRAKSFMGSSQPPP
jgi:hypothetical protein